jgi:L,D-transpeptidase YbiS
MTEAEQRTQEEYEVRFPEAGPLAPPPRARRGRLVAAVLSLALILILLAALLGTGVAYAPYVPGTPGDAAAGDLAKKRDLVLAKLQKLAPKGPYVVIDRMHNRLFVRQKGQEILSAVCSCGSGIVLSAGEKEWVFDTPPGVFKVEVKIEDPVWRKPDWAFIEEGKPIPKDPSERFEPEMMGEYALGFGNGYFIHGTLYTRLLGRSVTHGCIRLGRDDLRVLFKNANAGTPIYIF